MSTAGQPKTTAIEFEGVTPILRVENVEASIGYYVDVLGFKVDWQVKGYASVGRDRCHIMLAEEAQGQPGTWVWIGVEDAGRLYEEYKAKGAKIRHPPTNYEWAYELQVFDPDGHVLRLGSEPKQDEPIGPWLDENGVLWQKQSDGSFQKLERKWALRSEIAEQRIPAALLDSGVSPAQRIHQQHHNSPSQVSQWRRESPTWRRRDSSGRRRRSRSARAEQ